MFRKIQTLKKNEFNLLVTAFQPFLGQELNSSAEVLKVIRKKNPDLETLILPVDYAASFLQLKKKWLSGPSFQGLLMLGQAAGRETICLERNAINWIESSQPDEAGINPVPGRILAGEPDSYLVDFFSAEWAKSLGQPGQVVTSFTAGTYVCNALLFRAIHLLTRQKCPTLFVHLPLLPEQQAGSGSKSALTLAEQVAVVNQIIRDLESQRI